MTVRHKILFSTQVNKGMPRIRPIPVISFEKSFRACKFFFSNAGPIRRDRVMNVASDL